MTEQKTPSAPVETLDNDAEKTVTPELTGTPHENTPHEKTSGKNGGFLLGAIAIALTIALGAGMYYHGHRQASEQKLSVDNLQAQFAALKNAQSAAQTQDKQQLEALLKTQEQQLKAAGARLDSQSQLLTDLESKVAAMSSSNSKVWLIAQADFMVKMAGRKLWIDQDIISALALLKSADTSLADMNSPDMIDARRLLAEDISAVASIKSIDSDGIILGLNQLTNQIDNLRLTDTNSDQAPMDENSPELSSSLNEWRQNLSKSWKTFMAEFITIRRRDTHAEPLLAPNQDIYLRENLRARLLVAAQAVPRHQSEVYKLSLETVSTWVRAYFDPEDSVTKAFLEQLDKLSQESLNIDIPKTLKSQKAIEDLMQTRVLNPMAQQPAVVNQEG